jgi:hypothetical protein
MLNEHLDRLGYPTKKVERLVRGILALREQLLPARANLAATATRERIVATRPPDRPLTGNPLALRLFDVATISLRPSHPE